METQTVKETAKNYIDKAKAYEPEPKEDEFTKSVEKYTAAIPSSAYLAIALGAMGLSLGLQLIGRREAGNFVAQWVPTWLVIGLYNKLVKTEGHDQQDRGNSSPS